MAIYLQLRPHLVYISTNDVACHQTYHLSWLNCISFNATKIMEAKQETNQDCDPTLHSQPKHNLKSCACMCTCVCVCV